MCRIGIAFLAVIAAVSCQKNNGPFKISIIPPETTPPGEYRTIRLAGVGNATADASGAGRDATLDRLLDVYNPHVLVGIWNRTEMTNSTCHKDMSTFLVQLNERQIWAMRSKYLHHTKYFQSNTN